MAVAKRSARRWWSVLALASLWATLGACATSPAPARRVAPPTPVIVLPLFDADAAARGLPSAHAPGPLAVRDVRPEGPGDGRGIRLRLDRAVVDPSAPPVGVALELERIDADGRRHRVPARSTWARADTLVLEPDAPLPEATAFAVRLQGRITDVRGDHVEGIAWQFETARPTLTLHDGEALGDTEPLYLTPSLPMDPATVAAHLEVRHKGGGALATRVRRLDADTREQQGLPEHTLAIAPARRWPAGATVELAIDGRLTATIGSLPIAAPWRAQRVVRPAFTVGALACAATDGDRCALGPITLATSTAVDAESLSAIRIEPPLDDVVIDVGPDGVVIDGDWRADRRYRIVVGRGLTDAHGRTLARARRLELRTGHALAPGVPSLALSSSRGIFTAPDEAIIGVHTRHVRELRVRTATVPVDEAIALLRAADVARVPWPQTDRDAVTYHRPAGDAHRWQWTALPLGGGAQRGDVVLVEVRAVELDGSAEAPAMVRGLFQISALGVAVHRGPRSGFVRVTSHDRGEPLRDADVRVIAASGDERHSRTDRHGLARTGGAGDGRHAPLVLVQHGDDALALRLTPHPWLTADRRRAGRMTPRGRLAVSPGAATSPPTVAPGLARGEFALVEIFTGRAVYAPGDAIHLAGWAGISTPHGRWATRRVPPGTSVTITLQRRDDAVVRTTARIDAHGRFATTLRIPAAAALDDHVLRAELPGGTAEVRLVVAQPRIPTFELDAVSGADELLRGTPITLDVAANYLSGEPATLAAARASVRCNPTALWGTDALPRGYSTASSFEPTPRSFALEVAPQGASARFEQATADLDHRRPWWCSIAVAAADEGLQEVGADAGVLVHPARAYLALRAGEPVAARAHTVEVIAVDRRGVRVALPDVVVDVERIDAKRGNHPVAHCRLDIAAAGAPGRCTTSRLRAGEHRVLATATVDGAPIALRRELRVDPPPPRAREVAVAPPPPVLPPRPPPERHFELTIPSSVRPGVPTEVAIVGPWDRAHGVLAVEQIGLREVIPFTLEGGRASVTVTPAAHLGPTLELVARVATGGSEFTAEATRELDDDTGLRVQITAPARARAGHEVPVVVSVTDAAAQPVDARVALWVVDEGVLQLREAHAPALASTFNPARRGERSVTRSFDALLEPYAWRWGRRSTRAPSVRQASANVSGNLTPEIRRRFDAAPLFVGNVGTGDDGEVTVTLPLPDDLTRFRVTAIVSASVPGHPDSGPARFGVATSAIATAAPLQVRAAMPRVLRPGDRATVAALVAMPRGGELEVSLALPGDGAEAVGATRKRVRGEAGTTVRVPFVLRAGAPGTARVRVHARLAAAPDDLARSGAVELAIPVEPERTQIDVVALHGSVDDDGAVAVPIRLPARAVPGTGQLEVTTSSTLLGELDVAADYLTDYPYGCVEQSASRLVPLLALGGLADRSAAGTAALPHVRESIAYILSMQLADGTFAYWPGDRETAGFAGAYALWLLQLAHDRGIDVPERALARARAGMAALLRADGGDADDRLARVMILHALATAGEAKPADFDAIHRDRGALSAAGRMLLAVALHHAAPADPRLPELVRGVGALLEERAGVAFVVPAQGVETADWDSPARDDAIALMSLLTLAPDDPRIDKLARGLVARRDKGRWRTTQENAFALLALGEYTARREAAVPDHRVRAWIGAQAVLDAEVAGFDGVRRGGTVALDTLGAPGGTTAVTLQRAGQGRVHWRVGVRWAEAAPQPRAQGLSLHTRILDVDGAEVTRLVAGQRYRMEVSLRSETPQQYIAVELPLPAGVDAIERNLGHGIAARAGRLEHSGASLSHLELRPDRALLFFDALEPGTTVQQIAVLATSAGTYAVPGAVAEAMYEPETRARTRATRLEIVSRADRAAP